MVQRARDDSFSQFYQPGADYLHPTSSTFGTADRAFLERSFKYHATTLRKRLLRLSNSVSRGSLSPARFTTEARAAIRSAYFFVYSLGAISVYPFYTLTDRDVRVLDEALSEETGFLTQFGRDLAGGHVHLDNVSRSGLYLLALRGIFERGRLEAMPPGPYEWRLGITEHCIPCRTAAEGGPYQRDSTSGLGLPVLPGSPGDGSVCLGLTRCGCIIKLASGVSIPGDDLAEQMRTWLLEIAYGPGSSR